MIERFFALSAMFASPIGPRIRSRYARGRKQSAFARSHLSKAAGGLSQTLLACSLCALFLASPSGAEAQSSVQTQASSTASQTPSGDDYSSLLPSDRDETANDDDQTWSLKKLPPQKYMKEIYWHFPDNMPAFFRDSLLQIVARTYCFSRDNFNGSRSLAWADGGWIAYRSGLIANIFGVQAAFYTSQPLVAPIDEGGTRLLTPEQDPINVLGQAYARAQIFDQEFRAGRQLIDTPLINPQDNRMVPNTFEGIALVTLPDPQRSYDYSVGYLTDVKQRDSNTFISMSDALAGQHAADRGAPFGMVAYRPFSGLSTVFMDYYVQDFINSGFAQAEYDFKQPATRPNLILGANVIDQQSVGSDLLTGTQFGTFQASAKAQMVFAGWTLFTAGSITGKGSNIFSPFGTKPNYTDMLQSSFDNADEKALGGSLAYDFGYAFGKYGLSGLSAGVWDTQGWGAVNPTSDLAIPDRNEFDVWLQYRPTSGLLQGFRFKVQYSDVWQQGNFTNPQRELRLILDYTALYRPMVAE